MDGRAMAHRKLAAVPVHHGQHALLATPGRVHRAVIHQPMPPPQHRCARDPRQFELRLEHPGLVLVLFLLDLVVDQKDAHQPVIPKAAHLTPDHHLRLRGVERYRPELAPDQHQRNARGTARNTLPHQRGLPGRRSDGLTLDAQVLPPMRADRQRLRIARHCGGQPDRGRHQGIGGQPGIIGTAILAAPITILGQHIVFGSTQALRLGRQHAQQVAVARRAELARQFLVGAPRWAEQVFGDQVLQFRSQRHRTRYRSSQQRRYCRRKGRRCSSE